MRREEQDNGGPGQLGLLASALSGRTLRVAPGEPGEPAWTNGRMVFIDADTSKRDQLEALAVQASLLAAGSLEPDLKRPLITVACHDDLTAADLVVRFLLRGGETEWVDGPLTRAVREGAICYLGEVVEARQDTTVVLHPLTDHRRQLPIERLGLTVDAAPGFCPVASYNPEYQSVLKDFQDSTRQRMVAIEFSFAPPDVEEKIVDHETGIESDRVAEFVRCGQAIRRLETTGLREVASTRVLIAEGLSPREAARAAIAGPLTDDPSVTSGLVEMMDAYLSDTGR